MRLPLSPAVTVSACLQQAGLSAAEVRVVDVERLRRKSTRPTGDDAWLA